MDSAYCRDQGGALAFWAAPYDEAHLCSSAGYEEWQYDPLCGCSVPLGSPWGEHGWVITAWFKRMCQGQLYAVTPPVLPQQI